MISLIYLHRGLWCHGHWWCGHGHDALLLDHAQCAVQEGTNLAGEPRDDLVLVDVEVPAERTAR